MKRKGIRCDCEVSARLLHNSDAQSQTCPSQDDPNCRSERRTVRQSGIRECRGSLFNIIQGNSMNRRHLLKSLIGIAFSAMAATATAADTIKVGVLHSLSGTLAISETAL